MGATKCSGVYNSDSRVKKNISDFVAQGGRLYVSDWSYQYVRRIPGYATWSGENSQIGSACMGGGGEQLVRNQDAGLSAWLTAQGKSRRRSKMRGRRSARCKRSGNRCRWQAREGEAEGVGGGECAGHHQPADLAAVA